MFPLLTVDLAKLKHNAQLIVSLCQTASVEVCGVTKGVLGSVEVASAMAQGGIKIVGDSRLDSLKKLKKAKASSNLWMLRQPMKAEAKEAVKVASTILVSELEATEVLACEARRQGKTIGVILMVETGDLREGIIPRELSRVAKEVLTSKGVKLQGIATNANCFSKTTPTLKSLLALCSLANDVEKALGVELQIVSGGNSSALSLIEKKTLPKKINQLRIGEAILLGHKTPYSTPLKGVFRDSFVLSAETLEVRKKPSSFKEGVKGELVCQAVVALGKQDVAEGKLKLLLEGVKIARVSSDHLVLCLDEAGKKLKMGDVVRFIPSYFALLQAMTSPFVEKKFMSNSGE